MITASKTTPTGGLLVLAGFGAFLAAGLGLGWLGAAALGAGAAFTAAGAAGAGFIWSIGRAENFGSVFDFLSWENQWCLGFFLPISLISWPTSRIMLSSSSSSSADFRTPPGAATG